MALGGFLAAFPFGEMQTREKGQSPRRFIFILKVAVPNAIHPRLRRRTPSSPFSPASPKAPKLQGPALPRLQG